MKIIRYKNDGKLSAGNIAEVRGIVNKDGTISSEEFTRNMRMMVPAAKQEEIRTLFVRFDTKDMGELDLEDFRAELKQLERRAHKARDEERRAQKRRATNSGKRRLGMSSIVDFVDLELKFSHISSDLTGFTHLNCEQIYQNCWLYGYFVYFH